MPSTRRYRRGIALSRAGWTGVSPGPAPDLRTDEQICAGRRAAWSAAMAAMRNARHGVPPGFLAIVLWDAGAPVQAEAVHFARRLPDDTDDRYWAEPSGEGAVHVALLQVASWATHGRASKRLAASHVRYGASRSKLHRFFVPILSRDALLVVALTAQGRGEHGAVLADVCRRVTLTGPYAVTAPDGPGD